MYILETQWSTNTITIGTLDQVSKSVREVWSVYYYYYYYSMLCFQSELTSLVHPDWIIERLYFRDAQYVDRDRPVDRKGIMDRSHGITKKIIDSLSSSAL